MKKISKNIYVRAAWHTLRVLMIFLVLWYGGMHFWRKFGVEGLLFLSAVMFLYSSFLWFMADDFEDKKENEKYPR